MRSGVSLPNNNPWMGARACYNRHRGDRPHVVGENDPAGSAPSWWPPARVCRRGGCPSAQWAAAASARQAGAASLQASRPAPPEEDDEASAAETGPPPGLCPSARWAAAAGVRQAGTTGLPTGRRVGWELPPEGDGEASAAEAGPPPGLCPSAQRAAAASARQQEQEPAGGSAKNCPQRMTVRRRQAPRVASSPALSGAPVQLQGRRAMRGA